MRTRFEEQLALLKRELTAMGHLCERAIELTAQALDGKSELARDISALEVEIDQMERSIESLCLSLLLREQPVAADLRSVSAALKMITDLERIGDQTSDIADIILAMEPAHQADAAALRRMAAMTSDMVTLSIDAFVRSSSDLAKKVAIADDAVDQTFNEIKQMLIRELLLEPESGALDLDLLMIAKYFERIGDHAVNVAEWVVFSIDGTHKGTHLLESAEPLQPQ